jgi:hypothetical protein
VIWHAGETQAKSCLRQEETSVSHAAGVVKQPDQTPFIAGMAMLLSTAYRVWAAWRFAMRMPFPVFGTTDDREAANFVNVKVRPANTPELWHSFRKWWQALRPGAAPHWI